ncbi:GntR family transcriptional regulator [Arthrobacter sp. MW3 TE3886]|uniref:GntR family transcriptional regulator n=1 Tax=Arthrobacter sp. MW3 TE3886 TaxID=3156254 RepID=UPI003512E119
MVTPEGLTFGSVVPQISWRKQDWAYEQVREWILDGELKPGTRIDQEQLTAALGISRIPLREALAHLVAEGWIVGQPHRHLVVSELSLADARDVYSGRQAVESMLAGAAAQKARPDSLDSVLEVLARQREAFSTAAIKEVQRLDKQFHMGIYQLARMPKTLASATTLYSMSERYVRLYLGDAERSMTSFHEHEAIMSAVASGDADAARKLTDEHIAHGLQVLEERSLQIMN